jgi:hypothetical protein
MAKKPADDEDEDDRVKEAKIQKDKDDKPSGMKLKLITSFRRQDGRHFTPGMIVEATTAEVKLLVGGGYATIAKDHEEPSPLPEPDPI